MFLEFYTRGFVTFLFAFNFFLLKGEYFFYRRHFEGGGDIVIFVEVLGGKINWSVSPCGSLEENGFGLFQKSSHNLPKHQYILASDKVHPTGNITVEVSDDHPLDGVLED